MAEFDRTRDKLLQASFQTYASLRQHVLKRELTTTPYASDGSDPFDVLLGRYRDAANAVALYDYRKAYAETVNEVTGADLNDIPNPHDSINEAAAKFKELFDV